MISVQVVSTHTLDSRPSVVIQGEGKRILVNCGEGVQRLAIEQRLRLARLDAVCLTECNAFVTGGLIGLCLTAHDAGLKELTVHGPSGVRSLWHSTQSFMRLPNFHQHIAEYGSSLMPYTVPANADGVSIHVVPLTATKLCFMFSTSPSPGKFDVAAARALGIPAGPDYATLKRGQPVVLADGRTIQPSKVVAPVDPSCFVVVVGDLAALDTEGLMHAGDGAARATYANIKALLENNVFNRFVSGGENAGELQAVYHMSSISVVTHPVYQQWIYSLGPSVHHVHLGKGMCITQTSFMASTSQTAKLNALCPTLFPNLPHCWGVPHHAYESSDMTGDTVAVISGLGPGPSPIPTPPLSVPGYPGLSYTLLPSRNRGFCNDVLARSPLRHLADTSDVLDKMRTGFIATTHETSEVSSALMHLQSIQLQQEQQQQEEEEEKEEKEEQHQQQEDSEDEEVQQQRLQRMLGKWADTHLIFLGTGCAVPSKYRNVSGMYLHMPRGGIIIDPGEGSWAQLLRTVHSPGCAMRLGLSANPVTAPTLPPLPVTTDTTPPFPPDRPALDMLLQQALAAHVKLIWISHPHADHHLGALRIFEERLLLLGETAYKQPLLVVAPAAVLSFLDAYVEAHPALQGSFTCMSTRLFDREDDLRRSDDWWTGKGKGKGSPRGVEGDGHEQRRVASNYIHALGLNHLESVRVEHVIQSYGLVITAQAGWKFVYSGDTRPCELLAKAGASATLLVHEATFEDTAEKEAFARAHSTVSEALGVGKRMGAYRTVLTHFSQRYQGTPALPLGSSDLQSAILAFDYMHLCFAHLDWAPALIPVLVHCFPPTTEKVFPQDPQDKEENESPSQQQQQQQEQQQQDEEEEDEEETRLSCGPVCHCVDMVMCMACVPTAAPMLSSRPASEKGDPLPPTKKART